MKTFPPASGLSRAGITLLCIWLGIVIYAHLSGLSGLLTFHEYQFNPWILIRGSTLYIFLPWVLLVPLVYAIARKVPVDPGRWLSSLLRHAGLMSLLALLHGYAAARLYYHIGYFSNGMEAYAPWQHTGHFLFGENMYLVDAVIYTCLIGSQNINLNYFRARQHELDRIRLQSQLTEAKLMALKMQVNPHFLFNTLNGIAVLIRKQELARAEAMINSLGDFFRRTLECGEEQLISLQEEVDLIRHYLDLEKIRFGDRLQVEFSLADDCLYEPVPALLLQPLAENAVKHGLAGKSHCRLSLTARRLAEGLELRMHDNGSGEGVVRHGLGVGLENVRTRLQTLYNGMQRFEFTQNASGCLVRILIPSSASGARA